MAGRQLSDGRSEGIVLGNSATDPIGFHGKTATTLRSAPASIGTSATTAILKAAINKIRNALITKGIIV